jgi:uncharacterized protein YkwD
VTITTYKVQPGDTLMGIALAHGVPMAAIQLSSDLGSETMVWVDQELSIPSGGMWENASPFWSVYEVVGGDTLSEVAARFGLAVGDLLVANGLSEEDLIAVGQPLVLPLDGASDGWADLTETQASPAATQVDDPVPTAVAADQTVTDAADPAAEDTASAEGVQAGSASESAEAEPMDVAPTATPEPTVSAPPSEAVEDEVVANPAPPADTSALASEIFRLVNEQRAAYGLPPLAWNATLAQAAQLHADDCYVRGWCGHTGSDGASYKTRIIRAGYDPVRWSECWAWYGTPEMAVAMWMDEVPPNDPHRRTILSDYLVEVGVGVVPGNGHGYYFIADFGTPRE